MDPVDYQLEILQAYKAGKEIEYIPKGCTKELYNWKTIQYHPDSLVYPHTFNFIENDYRIKKEIKCREYNSINEFYKDAKKYGRVVRLKNSDRFLTIIEFEQLRAYPVLISVAFRTTDNTIRCEKYTVKEFLDSFTWPDGSPCGVIEQ